MKVVILAGGLGTRLSEETTLSPKPMLEIGGHPILWHIMKIYSYWGFDDFIILSGYKSHIIKEYFINYYTRYSDITVDMSNNSVEIHKNRNESWKVTIMYTGEHTMTGGRLLQVKDFIGENTFMLTYGDGLSDVIVPHLLEFHKEARKVATVLGIQLSGRFGTISIDENSIANSFEEKKREEQWTNGGFFVLEPSIFDYLDNDDACVFEIEPMASLVEKQQLAVFKHTGFWHAMDTLKDKNNLTKMWFEEKSPWSIWKNTI
ncbi:MAG: glucose-1-phosphate cytidylyltransferase [Desulfovibrionaceae bacterium]